MICQHAEKTTLTLNNFNHDKKNYLKKKHAFIMMDKNVFVSLVI